MHNCNGWQDSLYVGYIEKQKDKQKISIPVIHYETAGYECEEAEVEMISFCPFCGAHIR